MSHNDHPGPALARRAALLSLLTCAGFAAPARAAVINFDDRPGRPVPAGEGSPAAPEYFVDDEYASLGVVFASAGGGVVIVATQNPVSAPNVATASRPGQLTYEEPVTATFVLGGLPAVVDDVALTMTDSTSPSRLEAYDPAGTLLGSATGGASATLRVAFPGQIHSVVIQQGPMAFDNFTFTGLAPIPEPTAPALAASAAATQLLRRRRRQ